MFLPVNAEKMRSNTNKFDSIGRFGSPWLKVTGYEKISNRMGEFSPEIYSTFRLRNLNGKNNTIRLKKEFE